jgi:hypothetical protein
MEVGGDDEVGEALAVRLQKRAQMFVDAMRSHCGRIAVILVIVSPFHAPQQGAFEDGYPFGDHHHRVAHCLAGVVSLPAAENIEEKLTHNAVRDAVTPFDVDQARLADGHHG